MSDVRFLICWLLALFVAGVAVRDLMAGTSGVSGGVMRLRFSRAADPVGYVALIALKLGIAGYMTFLALRFAGWVPAVAGHPTI